MLLHYSIIIPTYNHCEDLLKPCLESILKYTDLDDIEILVVANGCTDNTENYVNSLGKHFRLIWFNEPLGYTKAINEGIKQSIGEFIILLNNDVEILTSEKNYWLERLYKPFIDNTNTAISGPLCLHDHDVNNNFIVFFCAMIPKYIFDTVGLLDEQFNPGYGEDIDFTLRIKKAGYEIACVDKMEFKNNTFVGTYPIYHKNNKTFGTIPEYNSIVEKNRLVLKEKYKNNEFKTMKLNLACGYDYDPMYINVDLYAPEAARVDFRYDVKKLPYEDNTIDEIKASHIIEHFDFFEGQEVLKEWYRVLKPRGKLLIETPDFLTSCIEFVNANEQERIALYGHFFACPWVPGQTHKFLFTETQLRSQLEWLNFKNIIRINPVSNYVTKGKEHLFLTLEAYK